MQSLLRMSFLLAAIMILCCHCPIGYAAPTQNDKSKIDVQSIIHQLAIKDETIQGLRVQIRNLQTKKAGSEVGSENNQPVKSNSNPEITTLSKVQIHKLFEDKDRIIADLQKQLTELQNQKDVEHTSVPPVPLVTHNASAITASTPSAKSPIPKYHYATTLEMKLEASVSFQPWCIPTDANGFLYVGANKEGIRVYKQDSYHGAIGYPNMADAHRAVDANGYPIEPENNFGPPGEPIFRAKDPNGQDFVLIDDRYTLSVIGHIWKPSALFVEGNIIAVADDFTKTIQVFKDGACSLSIILPPPPGGRDSSGRFTGIALTSSHDLFVLDVANNCLIHTDTKTNHVVGIYGAMGTGKSELFGPNGMFLKRDTQELYICDSLHYRIVVFNTQGKYVREFGSKGKGDGQFTSMEGIAIDNAGHVFVGDAKRIEVFTSDGQYLTQFGTVPKELSDKSSFEELINIYGLAADGQGRVYASDPDGYNIKVYELDAQ